MLSISARSWYVVSTPPGTLTLVIPPMQFQKAVADNILAFDQQFWMRIAARNDVADEEEKQRLASLATTVMQLVEVAVTRTEDQLANSGKIVQEVMKAAAGDGGTWNVPLPDDKIEAIKQVWSRTGMWQPGLTQATFRSQNVYPSVQGALLCCTLGAALNTTTCLIASQSATNVHPEL